VAESESGERKFDWKGNGSVRRGSAPGVKSQAVLLDIAQGRGLDDLGKKVMQDIH
jgi:hypothetical protein